MNGVEKCLNLATLDATADVYASLLNLVTRIRLNILAFSAGGQCYGDACHMV